MAGPDNARFPVMHVWGTAYEMGLAQGVLQKEELTKFAYGAYDYLVSEGTGSMGDHLPKFLQDILVEKGMNALLEANAEITAPFTPKSYLDEIQGLADGSGLSADMLLHLNLFPEITKASCSFFGAWGNATASGESLLQLRALDYVTDAPAFTNHPQLTVYHPSWAGGVSHASVAWPGVAGVLTGYSANAIGISEIGVSFPDDSFGQGTADTPPEKVSERYKCCAIGLLYTWPFVILAFSINLNDVVLQRPVLVFLAVPIHDLAPCVTPPKNTQLRGQPWMSVLKDVAQTATDLDSALAIVEDANRTCNLIIGLGSGKDGTYTNAMYDYTHCAQIRPALSEQSMV